MRFSVTNKTFKEKEELPKLLVGLYHSGPGGVAEEEIRMMIDR